MFPFDLDDYKGNDVSGDIRLYLICQQKMYDLFHKNTYMHIICYYYIIAVCSMYVKFLKKSKGGTLGKKNFS